MACNLFRRTFLQHSAYWGGLALANPLPSKGQDGAQLSALQREALRHRLADLDEQYDPNEKMIVTNVSGVGYHTTLKSGKVHNTRTSLQYAVALLDSGEEKRLKRAQAVLEKVISLQDQDPDSRTYGIWSWYSEEPLDKMSPPDWNWADFCGTQLLQAWIDHRNRLSDSLKQHVRESILHAARSIKRRNVGMGYTNIAIMGTYVTLAAAKYIGDGEIETYAKERLRRFHNYTLEQGTFTEYNSPTYTVVALTEIARMLMHIKDESDLALIRELHDLAWSHIARHFHAPTHQWAGPHSRWYSEILRGGNRTHAFLEMGLGTPGWMLSQNAVAQNLRHYRIDLHCPQKYRHYFKDLAEPRFEVETFRKARSNERQPVVGATYLHPQYTLGSVNQGDLWNQRRPVLAYWGTPEHPAYLRLRFLHDGYDYASALFFSQQNKNRLLAAVPFATDYGDTHVSLDRIENATIRAKDMRLRFELGGAINGESEAEALETVLLDHSPQNIHFVHRGIKIHVLPLKAVFGGHTVKREAKKEGELRVVDFIAYSGEERDIHFNELRQALFAFALWIGPSNAAVEGHPALQAEDNRVKLTWKDLGFRIPAKPMKKGELESGFTPFG